VPEAEILVLPLDGRHIELRRVRKDVPTGGQPLVPRENQRVQHILGKQAGAVAKWFRVKGYRWWK